MASRVFFGYSDAGGGGAQTLTQSSRHDNSNTFYTHVLTPGAVALVQVANFGAHSSGTIWCDDLQGLDVAYHGEPFVQIAAEGIDTFELDTAWQGQPFVTAPCASPNVFFTHTLTVGAVALTQTSRHDNSNGFYTHTLSQASGTQTLTQSARHDNAATFYTHTLTAGAVALTQSTRLDNANSFYTHLLTLAGTGTDICPSDLLTLNVAYLGQPFVHLQAYGIDTLELDTAYLGQPFIAQPYYESCEVIDPPEPEPEVDVTVRPSGGHFTYPYDDQHRYSHLSKTVKRIIHEVAKEQVEENLEEVGTQESQEFINQLITALAKADLKYQAFYAEILEAERQRLIDEEIKYLMGIKRMMDEEEEVLAVLMAIP